MLISLLDRSEPPLQPRWAPGDPVLVEVNGEPVQLPVVSVTLHSQRGVWVQVDVPVPVGTPARVGRFRRVTVG